MFAHDEYFSYLTHTHTQFVFKLTTSSWHTLEKTSCYLAECFNSFTWCTQSFTLWIYTYYLHTHMHTGYWCEYFTPIHKVKSQKTLTHLHTCTHKHMIPEHCYIIPQHYTLVFSRSFLFRFNFLVFLSFFMRTLFSLLVLSFVLLSLDRRWFGLPLKTLGPDTSTIFQFNWSLISPNSLVSCNLFNFHDMYPWIWCRVRACSWLCLIYASLK